MNKKIYFGAILLAAMTACSGALTSCIDNDEPRGIEELRTAKAELLRAKAQLELAKAEVEKQNAALVAAQAAVEQAKVDSAKAVAALEQAKAEAEAAKTAVEKAKAEAAIAQAKLNMEKAAEAHKAAMLQAEANTLKQKAELEAAMKAYEAAQSLLSDSLNTKLGELKADVLEAYNEVVKQQKNVFDKMQALYDATNDIDGLEAVLEGKVDSVENVLAAAKSAVERYNALLEATTPTEWEDQLDSIKAYKASETFNKAQIALELQQIKESAEYKTAQSDSAAAEAALAIAENNPTKIPAGKEAAKYAVSAIEIEVNNSYIAGKLGTLVQEGKLASSYDKNVATYDVLTAETEKMAADIKSWENAMKNAGIDAEALQIAKCELEAAEKALAEADSTFKADVKDWSAKHEQKETGKQIVTVATTKLEAAIAAYNTEHKTLVEKVAAYNTAYDETKTALYNANLEAKKITYAKTKIDDALTAEGVTGGIGSRNTLAKIDLLIESALSDATAVAAAKTAYRKAMNDEWILQSQAEINAKEEACDPAPLAVKAEKAVQDAAKAVGTALDELGKKKTALDDAINNADPKKGYIKELEAAAQVPTNKDGLDLNILTGVKAFDKDGKVVDVTYPTDGKEIGKEDAKIADLGTLVAPAVKKDAAGKKWEADGEYLMVVTDIINVEAAKAAAAGKLDKTLAETAWKKASDKAFGEENGVHAEIKAEDCKGGSGLALVNAQNTVNDLNDKIAAAADAETINAEIAAAKTTLESEKQAAKDAVEAAKKTLADAKTALTDMVKEQNDAIKEIDTKLASDQRIATKIQAVIDAYYDGTKYVKADGTLVDIKNVDDMKKAIKEDVEAAQTAVDAAEIALQTAKDNLQKFQETGEFNAVALAELELEQALAQLAVAEDAYEYAIERLEAYTAAISK